MVLLVPSDGRLPRARGAARGTLNETPEQVTAIVIPIGVAFVLLERGLGPLLYILIVQHGSHRLLYNVLPTIRFDLMDARVGGLMDETVATDQSLEPGRFLLP